MAANYKFAVIGLGQFGMAIARSLASSGAEVMAIDNDKNHVNQIKEEVAYAVTLDATDIKALRMQNIQDMDAAIIAIGEDFEALLLSTVMVQELKIKRIIARAANNQQREILERMGVSEILSPEQEVGKTVAQMLLHPTMKSFISLPDGYEIVEINTPKKTANRAINEIGLRENYDLNLITIKRTYEEQVKGKAKEVEHIIGVPRGDTILYESDILIVLGKTKNVDRFIEVNG